MLKITAVDGKDQRTLVLEGRLVEPWVTELQKNWDEVQRASGPQKVLIDLKDVTAISHNGEELLFRMMRQGVMFRCCRGVLTRHVVRQLEHRRREECRKAGIEP